MAPATMFHDLEIGQMMHSLSEALTETADKLQDDSKLIQASMSHLLGTLDKALISVKRKKGLDNNRNKSLEKAKKSGENGRKDV